MNKITKRELAEELFEYKDADLALSSISLTPYIKALKTLEAAWKTNKDLKKENATLGNLCTYIQARVDELEAKYEEF